MTTNSTQGGSGSGADGSNAGGGGNTGNQGTTTETKPAGRPYKVDRGGTIPNTKTR